MRPLLLIASGLFYITQADAQASRPNGNIQLLSDVAVSLTASPQLNLQPEQSVTFTITVTNKGPDVLAGFGIISSELFPEQIDLYGWTTDCGVVITSVTDGWPEPSYDVTWYPTQSSYTGGDDRPLAVGESRSCHMTMEVGFMPPPSFPIDFHLATYWHDIDPLDDTGRVVLQLAPIVEATPGLSMPAGVLLALGLFAGGVAGRERSAERLPAPHRTGESP